MLPFQFTYLLPHLVSNTCSIRGRSVTFPRSFSYSAFENYPKVKMILSPQLYSPSKYTRSSFCILGSQETM